MAKIISSDAYLQEQKSLNKTIAFIFAFLILLIIILMWIVNLLYGFTSIIGACMTIGAGILSWVFRDQAQKYIRIAICYKMGIIGEENVKNVLGLLPDTYTVIVSFHLPDNPSNIDFIVLSPFGIFTIEVKNVKGVISYDGRQLMQNNHLLEGKDILVQVRDQYWGLHAFLKEKTGKEYFISPILVFIRPKHYIHLEPKIGEIHIIHISDLIRFIENTKSEVITNQSEIEKALVG